MVIYLRPKPAIVPRNVKTHCEAARRRVAAVRPCQAVTTHARRMLRFSIFKVTSGGIHLPEENEECSFVADQLFFSGMKLPQICLQPVKLSIVVPVHAKDNH